MSDPEDLMGVPDDKPSPLALALLWAGTAVLAIVGVAVLLGVISALIAGPWWVR